MRTLRIWWTLLRAAARAELQYRGNLLIVIAGRMAWQGVGFAFIWVVVQRFGSVGGWSFAEIAFLYGMRLTSHALWIVPFNQVSYIDIPLREGEFDRYLVRPANPLIQLITRRMSVMGFGDLTGGLLLLVTAGLLADIDWSPLAVGYLLMAIVGGTLVEASIQLAMSGMSFRLLSVQALRLTVNDVFNTYGNYPLAIFPRVAQFVLTFMLPLAFVAYLPATVLLDRTDELAVSPWLAWFAPGLGIVLFTLAYRFWRYQMRFYSSSGS